MSKIGITGAGGFLGSHLLNYFLSKGHQVVAISQHYSFKKPKAQDNLEIHTCSILDAQSVEAALKNCDYIIHAAALVSYQSKDKYELYKQNIDGTRIVVNAALANACKQFMFISSASVYYYEYNMLKTTIKKQKSHEGGSQYAFSKFQAELDVWRGQAEGLSVNILRPALILGSGPWTRGSTSIVKKVNEGLSYYPSGSLGLVDVEDICKAVDAIWQQDEQGKQFLLVSEIWTYRAFFEKIALELNKPTQFRPLPKELAKILSIIDFIKSKISGNEQIITTETINNSYNQPDWAEEFEKLRYPMEYNPIHSSIHSMVQGFLKDNS